MKTIKWVDCDKHLGTENASCPYCMIDAERDQSFRLQKECNEKDEEIYYLRSYIRNLGAPLPSSVTED